MSSQPRITTASIEEGLDFACSLLSSAIASQGEAQPAQAAQLLNELTRYIELRYVGEPLLALEYLAGLGRASNPAKFRHEQFWAQVRWVVNQMHLSAEERERLELPDA